jgi:hypothetical protein
MTQPIDNAALVRSWEAKLASAEAEDDEDTAAQLRKNLREIWDCSTQSSDITKNVYIVADRRSFYGRL